jgi:imidazolonepropionase-like amidohydrolase
MRRWLAATAAIPVVAASAARAQAPERRPLIITNVSVVDVESGQVRAGQSIRIEGSRIRDVGTRQRVRVPDGVVTIDGTGKFVIPGLWDMHVHATGFGIDRLFLPMLVAHGVTGVRDMFGRVAWTDSARALGARGELAVPRIVGAGHILDGAPGIWPGSVTVKGAEETRRAVDSLAKAGAAFIKVYSRLSADEFRAAAEQAKANGLHFAGHVPQRVTVDEALALGMRTIEHLQQFTTACSSKEGEMRQQLVDAAASPKAWDSAAVIARQQLPVLVSTFDRVRCAALAQRVARSETWMVPTFTVLRSIAYLDDSTLRRDPRLKYIPQFFSASWDPSKDFRFRAVTAEGWQQRRQAHERQLEIGRLLRAAGAKFLAGTDLSNPYIFPGLSLHDELANFVEIGMSPLEALRTATLNPARFYQATDSLGSVAPGKVADLVILDGNPLDDIRHVGRIHAVVYDGRLVDPARRSALLSEAERLASGRR